MPKSKKKTTPTKPLDQYAKMYNVFSNNISSHEVAIKTIVLYAKEYDEKTMKEIFKGWEPSVVKKVPKSKLKKFTFKFTSEHLRDIFKKAPLQEALVARNTLVSIISTLDYLFAKLFETYYRANPSRLSLENQTIAFKDLKNISDIKEAQNYLINREVEKILLDNGLKNKLEGLKEMGLMLVFKEQDKKELARVIKIRNLIVHNEARADEEYITKYGDGKIKKGDKIKVSQKNLYEALSLVEFFGSLILQDAQNKFTKDPLGEQDYILVDSTHNILLRGDYEYLRSFYDYVNTTPCPDSSKKSITINYCIALKKQGKSVEHIKKVLDTLDWSIRNTLYDTAYAALVDDDKKFYLLLERLLKDPGCEIGRYELNTWGIFSLYRKKKKFKTLLALSSQ